MIETQPVKRRWSRWLNPKAVVRAGWRRCRQEWRTILFLPATPHQVALGVAVGVFVSVTPTPGCQMLIAGLLAAAVGGSVRAALPMVFLSNPLTGVPILWATYETGRLCWPWAPALTVPEMTAVFARATESVQGMIETGATLLMPLAIGGVLVGLVLGALSYPLMLAALSHRQRWLGAAPGAANVAGRIVPSSPRRAA